MSLTPSTVWVPQAVRKWSRAALDGASGRGPSLSQPNPERPGSELTGPAGLAHPGSPGASSHCWAPLFSPHLCGRLVPFPSRGNRVKGLSQDSQWKPLEGISKPLICGICGQKAQPELGPSICLNASEQKCPWAPAPWRKGWAGGPGGHGQVPSRPPSFPPLLCQLTDVRHPVTGCAGGTVVTKTSTPSSGAHGLTRPRGFE